MDTILLLTHSVVRYFALIFLIVLFVRSLMGWMNKSPFGSIDDKVSLWLFILAHTQLLLGLSLYFLSPRVVFSGESMKDPEMRYWLVEHGFMMLIAITLITIGRISIKKTNEQVLKHKRLFIYNSIAFVIIIAAIAMSGRGFFSLPE
jgi:hypothetical protein